MSSFMTKGAKHQQIDEANNDPHYLSHKDEPLDFYRKYEDENFMPKKGSHHRLNLFDDSDIKDNYWFNVARKFLRNY